MKIFESEKNIADSEAFLFENSDPNRFGCERFHKSMRHVNFGGGGGGDAAQIQETAEEKELASIARQKFELYQNDLAPLEDFYMGKVDDLNKEPSRKFSTGLAAQQTEKAYTDLGERVKDTEFNSGVNPNSGRFKSRLNEIHTTKAASSGENQAQAEMAQEQDYVTGMNNINAMGVGESTQAQGGFSRLAQNSAAKAADDAEMDWNSRANRLQTISSAAGAGAYYTNNRPKNEATV